MRIRNCTPDDAAELLDIYAPYVENTAISFEIGAPTFEEFRERIVKTLEKFPYIVAEEEGKILGYVYVGAFRTRKAFSHCVETSIYVADDARGKGIGTALYAEIERLMPALGISHLYACIAWTPTPDEHLDNRSEEFHARLGYETVAHFHRCGYKFGRYYDVIWMEKILNS